VLAASRSLRDAWRFDGRNWPAAWLQVSIASLLAGTVVPGLSPAALALSLAGCLVGAAACLDAAWAMALTQGVRRAFLALFAGLLALWTIVMIYGSFVWIMTMPYYRALGITMAFLVLAVALLGWFALATASSRRGLLVLVLVSIGLKLAHWGYYVPEWNYRRSQGPWGRAIAQWIPRKWSLYTFHDWPPDLAFSIRRPVRQLRSPRFLTYLPGSDSRYVLLQTSEYGNWPDHAPPITLVARFLDESGEERILARTSGLLPVPGNGPPQFRP
jgi:hypothetical protein